MGCKTTVLHRRVHLARPNRSLGPAQVNSARLRYPTHLPKTKTSLRLEGQASRNLTSSRTVPLQAVRPNRRDHRANRNSLNSRSFRRRCSKLRMDRNPLRVRPLLLSNFRLSRLRSSVVPLVRDNSRLFSNSRLNHSPNYRSLVNNHFSRNINNRRCRCNNHNSNNRRRERILSRIWSGCSNFSRFVVYWIFLEPGSVPSTVYSFFIDR